MRTQMPVEMNTEVTPDDRFWSIGNMLHVAVPVENEFEGIRCTVMIGSAEKYIYRAGHDWYVMA